MGSAHDKMGRKYSVYEGGKLSNEQDVIVVNFNYRLNAFGFLYSEKFQGEIKGNFGIYDCLLAMEWVKKNIEDFGGDSDNVTLFGERFFILIY